MSIFLNAQEVSIDGKDVLKLEMDGVTVWEKVAEAKAKVVISSDCHNPALLNDSDVQKCRDIAKNWGLHVIDAID